MTTHESTDGTSSEAGRSAQNQPDVVTLVAAIGLGAAAMYFLDPDRGRRRRNLLGQKLVHRTHVAADFSGTLTRDLGNRAQGAMAVATRPWRDDDVDDAVLVERVRTALGRAVSHPGSIEVAALDGRVTLSGPVLADEADDVLAAIRRVRGVEQVEDALDRHATADNVPGLQGNGRQPEDPFEFMQENWTPAARLVAVLTGGTLAAAALRQRGPAATLLGLAGAAFAVRGATNLPLDRLLGVGAGRRAIDIQKAINIAAPADEVFAWLTAWERWPEWMSHVREVRKVPGQDATRETTRWVVDGPAGTSVAWDAITTRFEPPELIAWKTAEGSPIAHAGMLRVVPTDEGTTRVDVQMSYNPVAGAMGHAVASLFRRDPAHQLADDLARLKTTIETGRPPHDAAAGGSRPSSAQSVEAAESAAI